MEQARSFRNFGIAPDDLPPPPEQVRCCFSSVTTFGQYLATFLCLLLGIGWAALVAMNYVGPLQLVATIAVVAAFGLLLYLVNRNAYGLIELEGTTLTARHLYTGFSIQRSLTDIESVRTLVHARVNLATAIAQRLLGRVKGIELRFRDDRTRLQILRADPAMINAQAMIEAILARMGQIGKLEADIIDFEGEPLVRTIVWRDARPQANKGNALLITLGCLMFLTLIFGTILGFIATTSQALRTLGAVPPQVVPLARLIENGPGDNRHVIVTDFQPAGYVFEESKSSTTYWVAIFPTGQPKQEIQAVFSSNSYHSEAELAQMMRAGRLTGICSAQKRSSWGTMLGPELVTSNDNLPLRAAWDIEELREVPSAESVRGYRLVAVSLFGVTIVLAATAFWLR